MRFRVMASRHSAFYSPLLCSIGFLRDEGHDVTYSVLKPGQRSYSLIRDGEIDIMQSAVSSNWSMREMGIEPLPVHFAQINQRDGFFLVGRQPDAAFAWQKLEGSTLLADHGPQPLVMLKYAAKTNGVDWKKIKVIDKRSPDQMEAAFSEGTGDYIHLQAPIASGEMVASVGQSMPPVAFSSLCCARAYQQTTEYRTFLAAYGRARAWVQSGPPEEVAAKESALFPQVSRERLVEAVRRYQGVGCWLGGIQIPPELYEQALNVFQAAGSVTWRHRYEEVVG